MGRSCTSFHQSEYAQGFLVEKSWVKICSLLFLWVFLGSVAKGRSLVDRVVAEVNSRPILYSEINEKVKKGPLVKVSDFPAQKEDPPFEHALQDAINLELVLSHAEFLEISVSDADIKSQVDRILQQNNIGLPQLKQFLAQQGKSYEEYEQDMYDQILFMRFRGRVLMPLVKITDKDVESYYLKKMGASSEALSLSIRKIFFSIPKGAQPSFVAQKEKLADEVYAKLKNGMDFVEAEKIYSELGDARDGKAAMNFKLTDLDKNIAKVVKPLDEKEFAKPLKWNNGIYIFYLESKKFAGSSHFLAKKQELEFELRQKELAEQMQRWLKEQRQKSKIRIIKG
ncbi:MAG: SurA N-terminal domain-containing protein [Oligoflexales bacterium]|nr:SurA N-terminal domain-containing protein [Oligoflexales bacterium]